MVNCIQDYASLCEKLREISTLGGIGGLLQWDEAVMMPAGAAESRGKQKSVLAGVVYEKVFKHAAPLLLCSPNASVIGPGIGKMALFRKTECCWTAACLRHDRQHFQSYLTCCYNCNGLQETSQELGKLLKTLTMHNKDLEPVQAAVVRDAQR